MLTSKECIKQIKSALKQFGEYNYYDKGPLQLTTMACFGGVLNCDCKRVWRRLVGVPEPKPPLNKHPLSWGTVNGPKQDSGSWAFKQVLKDGAK